MKTPTDHKITLSISQLEDLISMMKEHKSNNPDLSSSAIINLDYDTDMNSLVISDRIGNAKQFSSYAECNGHSFTI